MIDILLSQCILVFFVTHTTAHPALPAAAQSALGTGGSMSHFPVRDELIALANGTAGNPADFLAGLSDVHDNWHQPPIRTYGFLLFHHRVVRYFETIVNAGLQPPVVAFTDAELQNMNVPPYPQNVANVDTLFELATFSARIESWHDIAHSRIQTATGVPMMDARQNIYYRAFWQLHLAIDALFQQVLQQYGNQAHPGQFLDRAAVAGHIEAVHHGWVPRI